MKRVYFVRHGQSEANVAKVHGRLDTPLTERGREQAQFIAERARGLPVTRIVASDYVRAQQTAGYIAQKKNLAVEVSPLFGEQRMPSVVVGTSYFEPTTVMHLLQMHEKFDIPGWRHSDEENFEDLHARALGALAFLASLPDEYILVVTHSLFLRVLAAHVILGPDASARECQKIIHALEAENTGLTVFDHQPLHYDDTEPKGEWRLWVWNDHAHLG